MAFCSLNRVCLSALFCFKLATWSAILITPFRVIQSPIDRLLRIQGMKGETFVASKSSNKNTMRVGLKET
jgi:hypothetical protein